MNSIALVHEFHQVFGHLISPKPTLPSEKTLNFRSNFIKEELDELRKGSEEGDLVEVADGLGDIQYVLDGFFIECGLHDKKDAIMAEIHRSNMSKVCRTQEDAERTIEELDVPAHWEKRGEFFVVKRTSDGKVMKAWNYSPADLKSIVEG